jgi:opacity protein-like surface antigen
MKSAYFLLIATSLLMSATVLADNTSVASPAPASASEPPASPAQAPAPPPPAQASPAQAQAQTQAQAQAQTQTQTQTPQAQPPQTPPPPPPPIWVVTVEAGPVWSSPGETQTLRLQPDIEKAYHARKQNLGLTSGGIFLGVQQEFKTTFATFFSQLGLAFSASDEGKVQGDVWEDAAPGFNDFTYQYKIIHTHLAVKGKLIADLGYFVQPYLSASLGVGFNRAYEFTITQKIEEQLPAPPFKSNAQTAFTYTVGIGLQKAIAENWRMGIGYEFSDWGTSFLARAQGQTMSHGLLLNHVYTHELQFSLSYIA